MTDFGLQIEPQLGFSFDGIAALAHECRPNGFTSLWASDHFMLNTDAEDRDCLECWTLLSALSVEVSDIRLGSLVTCANYRNPALLAKIVAGVDQISGGRIEFGIGAGWKDIEYKAYGYRFPSPGERVDRLIESIEIIRSLWTQPRTTYKGDHYSVEDAVSSPKPAQKPHPPILIGGSRPRVLRVMARYADAINFVPQPDAETYAQLQDKLRDACRAEGTEYDRLRFSHFATFVVGKDENDLQRRLERAAAFDGLSVDDYRAKRSRAFIGTAAECVDFLRRYTRLGVSQFQCVFPYGEELDSMKIFADHVIPHA